MFLLCLDYLSPYNLLYGSTALLSYIITTLFHDVLTLFIFSFCLVSLHVCIMVITYSRLWINRVRLPILLVVS